MAGETRNEKRETETETKIGKFYIYEKIKTSINLKGS